MSSVNKSIIVGYLGKNPEVRYMPDGNAVANLSVATSESWKDKQTGEKKEKTEWHRLVVYGKLAEVCERYLKKGSLVYFDGKIQTKKWTDKDGIDRYATEIVVNNMTMLGGKSEYSQSNNDQPSEPNQPSGGGVADMDDDIPF